jgi:Lrp/AsnC family leucine-responsive transcriptional regulator
MEKIRLDKKDYKILYQLDLNSRQSDAEIGRKVGLSREVVKYRIKNLIKKGVIERFYTIIDVAKLGLTSYKIYLQFQNLNKEKEKDIVNFFLNHPNFEWLGSCSGRWDMIIGIWAENIHQFNRIFMEFSDKYGQYIMNQAFTTTLGVLHYRKEYLINKKIATVPMVYFGGEPKKEKLDKIDTEILKVLANNARMPLVEIAEKVKTSPRVVGYRIKELQRKGVIQAFRVTINLNKLNYMFIKVFFYLQNITDEKLKKFISYCGSNPNIGWVILCVGPWNIEIEFEIENLEKFHEVMKNIREEFGGFIRGVESVIIHNDYGGTRYFPNCYGKIDKIYNSK